MPLPPPVQVEALPAGAATQTITFARAAIKLSDGEVWGNVGSTLACDALDVRVLKWKAGDSELKADRLAAIFTEELKKAGFRTQANDDDLFNAHQPTDGLQVGALVTNMLAQVCTEQKVIIRRASLVMTVDWQVYDPIRREVVARLSTSGGHEEKGRSQDDLDLAFSGAFRESARALLANPQFRTLALKAQDQADAASALTAAGPIVLARTRMQSPQDVKDAAGSVVAIFAGDVYGSGFLVSEDGYLITNQHVVGLAKQVRVRWSDGFETTGEVVRTHKARDVALIKTEPHGRAPLALLRRLPQPGDTVIAIGTPLDEKWQGTVTKGVVSANRIENGFSFIQSDVAVDHGNSGGPLLDEKGEVVGITDWGYSPDGVSHNLNFFIPIGDALDFLALKPQS